jgi:hypothetical protein
MGSTNDAWPDAVDEIFARDCVVMLAYVTPANGAVLTPVTNFRVRDRSAGTLTAVNSSVGVWKKLERIGRNPRIALAFHTRKHAASSRREYVLVQGTASLSAPVPDYPAVNAEAWEPLESWRDVHPLWKWWLRIWALRVAIEVAVERLVVWPDLDCRGTPAVHGVPLPAEPPIPQRPPRDGTNPRMNPARAARRASRLPDVLLGWVGSDGFPVVVPVGVEGSDRRGIALEIPHGIVPAGGRRAGLTAHWFDRAFTRGVPTGWGMSVRVHTGWLDAGSGEPHAMYSPHTSAGYSYPTSTVLYRLLAGFSTRWGLRGARRAGVLRSASFPYARRRDRRE